MLAMTLGRSVLLLATLVLLSAEAKTQTKANMQESPLQAAYPDPRKQPGACGRSGLRKSRVCDPHHGLTKAAADRVDMVARSVSNYGPDPAVVVMKKILGANLEQRDKFTCQDKARATATTILSSWQGEELILVSKDDHQFCLVQRGNSLSQHDVAEIEDSVADLLSAQGNTRVDLLDQAISYALLQVQQKATEDAPVSLDSTIVPPPTGKEMVQMIIAHTIPFIGFGITDNGLMIICGEVIEQFLGASMGLSTMGAAATGNLLSDIAGIFLGGQVQAISYMLGASEPDFTKEQRQLPTTRYCKMFGESLGITIGCIIGMAPLLFVEHTSELELPSESLKTLPHVRSMETFTA